MYLSFGFGSRKGLLHWNHGLGDPYIAYGAALRTFSLVSRGCPAARQADGALGTLTSAEEDCMLGIRKHSPKKSLGPQTTVKFQGDPPRC